MGKNNCDWREGGRFHSYFNRMDNYLNNYWNSNEWDNQIGSGMYNNMSNMSSSDNMLALRRMRANTPGGMNMDHSSMQNLLSFFNNPKLISPHSDSMLLRTNFFLAKEKSDFRGFSQDLNKNFTQNMVFMPNLSMARGPLCFGAPFLPMPVEFDLVNMSFPRCPKVSECPVSGAMRFEDD